MIGYRFERWIERHLGTPPTVAAGLFVGALAMAVADRSPQERDPRRRGSARRAVARRGAGVLAAAGRLAQRGDAGGGAVAALHAGGRQRLSRHSALPIIAGATLLKGVRLHSAGCRAGAAVPFAAGAAAAFVSTLASTWLIQALERDSSLLPYALYRIALAAVIARRLAARAIVPVITPARWRVATARARDDDAVNVAFGVAGRSSATFRRDYRGSTAPLGVCEVPSATLTPRRGRFGGG